MADHDFEERLQWSTGMASADEVATIEALLPGTDLIRAANRDEQAKGIDWIVTLRRGAEVNIDAKRRSPGCRYHWTNGPELQLETWSVVPDPAHGWPGKVGWTLDEHNQTDMILYLFDPSDCDYAYLVPFQSLRIAFRRNWHWWPNHYPRHRQSSNGGEWESEAIFVPVPVVWQAMEDAARGLGQLYLFT